MPDKTTEEKCRDILLAILDECNAAPDPTIPAIGFRADWGGNSLTVYKGTAHSHVGSVSDDGTFDQLIDQLHDLLIKGRGLSWE